MSKQEDAWEKVDKIYETIFEGNGEPSLKAQIATINAKLGNPCPVGVKNATSLRWMWICGGMVTTAMIAMIAFFHL